MDFGKTVADFLANPFDPNSDGKTSAVELFWALVLVGALIFAQKRILKLIFME